MKNISFKIIFLLCVLLIAGKTPVSGQIIKGMAFGGLNVTQVDGDEVFGWHKFGGHAGVGAIVPVSDMFEFALEITFNQKGAYQKPQREGELTGEYKLRLNYLEVPVLFHFNDRDKFQVGVGGSWGRLVGVEEWEHGKKVTTTNINGPYDRNDFCVLGDVRFAVYKRLKFNVRYGYSLSKIRTRVYTPISGTTAWARDQFNNFWTLRVVYIFNEDESRRARNISQ